MYQSSFMRLKMPGEKKYTMNIAALMQTARLQINGRFYVNKYVCVCLTLLFSAPRLSTFVSELPS